VLMSGVRGQDETPGEFRTGPSWIGSPSPTLTPSPDDATFVPPFPEAMHTALDNLQTYLNDDVALPVLVRCALVHCQFETIRPFLDGNGRLGRLLALFYLVQQGLLPQPLLSLSAPSGSQIFAGATVSSSRPPEVEPARSSICCWRTHTSRFAKSRRDSASPSLAH
jgi:Fic family protein